MRAALAVALLLLAGCAHAQLAITGVCSGYRFKGQAGDLLIVCPTGKVVRLVKPCAGGTVRAFYRGADAALTCGTRNPYLDNQPIRQTIKVG